MKQSVGLLRLGSPVSMKELEASLLVESSCIRDA